MRRKERRKEGNKYRRPEEREKGRIYFFLFSSCFPKFFPFSLPSIVIIRKSNNNKDGSQRKNEREWKVLDLQKYYGKKQK